MVFKEYIKLAMRTNVKDRSFKDNILNGLLGLYGEITEFTENNLTNIEMAVELGDIYWYLALLFDTLELEPMEVAGEGVRTIETIGKLSDHFKKHFFQGHDLDLPYIHHNLCLILRDLNETANNIMSSPEEVMELNIKKLKDRFPNGFSVSDSINREV